MTFDYIQTQLNIIKSEITDVCKKLDKDPEEITLIGVTKTYETDVINAAIAYGVTDIAENRVQEITRKYDDISKPVKVHLIGHLQTNKVKYIIDKVDLIHSVDSIKLANEIQKRAQRIGKIQDVLLQVNVADEKQKFGVSPDEVPDLLFEISKLPNVRVCGLMNIAPFVDDSETLRHDFKMMKSLFDGLNSYGYSNVCSRYLSMGMSNDFAVAIEEGSNMIRVGTKIFGLR